MKIFILDEYEPDAQFIKTHVSQLDEILVCSDFNKAVAYLKNNKPDIVFINITVISRLKELEIDLVNFVTIAIADSPEPEYLRLCMSIRAVDLLIKPLLIESIDIAYTKAKTQFQPAPHMPMGRLIAFFSPIPGVGQTFILSNLAAQIAINAKIVILDLSDSYATFNQIFNLKPPLIEPTYELYQDLFGLDLLIPNSNALTEAAIFTLINKVKKEYDIIFIDIPKKRENYAVLALNLTKILVFILTLDRNHLSKLSEDFAFIKSLNIASDHIILLANETTSAPTISKKEMEETLLHRIEYLMPRDTHIVDAAQIKHTPAILAFPNDLMSIKLIQLAQYLTK